MKLSKVKKYIAVAKKNADEFSRDPSTKVGCYIVDSLGTPMGMGYNGFPRGVDDSKLSWERPFKYDYVIHAEMNALHFTHKRWLDDCVMFITHSPCDDCLKNIIHRGIREVYYEDVSIVKERMKDKHAAIYSLIEASGISVKNCEGDSYAYDLGLV